MSQEKECRGCGQVLSLTEFYKHKSMADGHLNFCKPCVKSKVKDHRKRNIESIREYDRKRGNRQTPEYRQRMYEKYPNKRRAQIIVGNAIRDGKLFRMPCEECGANENIHAHHDDYLMPLNVRWLCAAHHAQWHKSNGHGRNQ